MKRFSGKHGIICISFKRHTHTYEQIMFYIFALLRIFGREMGMRHFAFAPDSFNHMLPHIAARLADHRMP